MQESIATIIPPGEGPQYWLLTDHQTLKLTADQTGGKFAMAESGIPPGGGPPPHIHHREDELFYILEGEYAFTLGDQRLRGGPGTVAFLPRGIVHQFKNMTDKPGRFVLIPRRAVKARRVVRAHRPRPFDCWEVVSPCTANVYGSAVRGRHRRRIAQDEPMMIWTRGSP